MKGGFPEFEFKRKSRRHSNSHNLVVKSLQNILAQGLAKVNHRRRHPDKTSGPRAYKDVPDSSPLAFPDKLIRGAWIAPSEVKMDGPRAPLESEFKNVVQFLDSQLRPSETWSITNEYPLAFGEANRGNIRIIADRDQVLSHALIRPLVIKTPVGLFKAAGIGSVVTSSEYRNKGLSTQIIQSCLDSARAQGCDFAILWTNLYDFYRRIGFELAGTEMSILFDKDIPLSNPSLRFMDTPQVAPEAIHRLYLQHTVTSLRNIDETRKYLQIPNTRVYTAWDETGTLKAYAVEGKGADLNGYVHEWGGGVSSLMPLFSHIRRTQQRPITIIAPRHSQNLLRACEENGLTIHQGYLGMIKLLNTSNLVSKIHRHARSLGIANFVAEHQESTFYVGVGENLLKTDLESDIIRLLFGPLKASEVAGLKPETAAAIERVLPLGMWIWGWDSV